MNADTAEPSAVGSDAFEQVGLTALLRRTRGVPEVAIALIDGPVATDLPALAAARIETLPGADRVGCADRRGIACLHGTFIASMFCADAASGVQPLCPGCSLLVRPIFGATASSAGGVPNATPEQLAGAIVETVDAGARVVNLSLALLSSSAQGEHALALALDHARRRGAIVVAAAGNQGGVGGTLLTRHPAVIPVTACDAAGRPLGMSNLGLSIARRGLAAPGSGIAGLGADGQLRRFTGTSVAAPFVSAAVALLWSVSPSASAAQIRVAIDRAHAAQRHGLVPPRLNAAAALAALSGPTRRSPSPTLTGAPRWNTPN